MSVNRWVPSSAQRQGAIDEDTPEVVARKVKSLLNKLTMEKFDSISHKIIAWANKSENEKDGRTLIQVIRLVFEKAIDDADRSEMYARLCRKMMETISPKVQDDGIKSTDGKPIRGGQLFRKYLLNQCQEDFERGWFAKEATARMEAKASDNEAVKAGNEKKGDESELYFDEDYAAQKAKRQSLGLIKFIGELFKVQMLTERIMHECVKKLLGNVENPEKEEIESLCQLLRTVGQFLDVPKARAHMDVYFQRMRELCKSASFSLRMKFMLQDIIELRDRKWQPRSVANVTTTLAAVHKAAAQETLAFRWQFSMSQGGSKRVAEPNAQPSPDGWAAAGFIPTAKLLEDGAIDPPKAFEYMAASSDPSTSTESTCNVAKLFAGRQSRSIPGPGGSPLPTSPRLAPPTDPYPGMPSSSTPSTSTKSSFNVAKLFQGDPSASQPSSDATSPSRPMPGSGGHRSPSMPIENEWTKWIRKRAAKRQRQEGTEAETRKEHNIFESLTQELLEVARDEMIENGEVFESHVNDASNIARNQKESLRIDTSEFARRRPGPLDNNSTKKGSSVPPFSALLTARKIDRLDEIEYPEGIRRPKTELNQNAKSGKFKYDRDFLMQFMAVCKEKPPNLPPLDILGIEHVDQTSFAMAPGGSARHRQSSGPMFAAGARLASTGLDPGPFPAGAPPGPFAMGQFGTPGNKLASEERFTMSQGARSASVGGGPAALLNRPPLTRTPSQGGPGGHPMGGHRARSKRGEKRTDLSKVGSVQQGPGFGPGAASSIPALEPVAPLEMSANRWVPSNAQREGAIDVDTPEVMDRKVKSLLNKLTMKKFDSISDQIIAWANKSENEKDGRTLIQVVRLVFEKATDEADRSEMYARLCRKMMETISPKVQDDGVKSTDGKPITGGQLFRKYLLNRCQEDFEHGWFAKEATARAAAAEANEDEAIKATNEKNGEESELYSDEYYASQKAKRQGLGLIKFIGELFKVQMLTERIMHECVKKLLGNVETPEKEEIESLCQLLRTVGQLLDVPKARAHMDVYFQRMRELCKSLNVSPRIQFMLQDVIELRDRKWQLRNAVNAPTTLAAVHEVAAQETQAFQRQFSKSRGGSKRGADRNAQPSPDGWVVAGGSQPRPPTKSGDLSHFGKISKVSPTVMGQSSVFAGKKDIKRESMTRTNWSSDMFLMLSQNPELAMEPKPSRAPSQKPSTDLGKSGPIPQRKKLQLLPRTIPALGETSSPSSEEEPEAAPAAQMSENDAQKKIDEDVKGFFAVRNLEETDAYFTSLPEEHRFRLVDKLVPSALESKEADARLVADFFSRPPSQQDWIHAMAELLEDIAIDAPKVFEYMAIMLKGAGIDKDEERMKRIAAKVMDSGDRLLQLVSS